ncbi:MAG: hypothetical protein ACRD0U_03100 [Acidimicrobiales bacterium]
MSERTLAVLVGTGIGLADEARARIEQHDGAVVRASADSLLAVFLTATAALTAAAAIQRAAPHAAPLSRLGIAVGDVVLTTAGAHGQGVEEASRLCTLASAGQVLVSDVVGHLTWGDHALHPCGPAVSELDWRIGARPAFPATLRPEPMFGLSPRLAEEAVLAEEWAAARAGRRRTVLISGEAGIGKSTLAARAARSAWGGRWTGGPWTM